MNRPTRPKYPSKGGVDRSKKLIRQGKIPILTASPLRFIALITKCIPYLSQSSRTPTSKVVGFGSWIIYEVEHFRGVCDIVEGHKEAAKGRGDKLACKDDAATSRAGARALSVWPLRPPCSLVPSLSPCLCLCLCMPAQPPLTPLGNLEEALRPPASLRRATMAIESNVRATSTLC